MMNFFECIEKHLNSLSDVVLLIFILIIIRSYSCGVVSAVFLCLSHAQSVGEHEVSRGLKLSLPGASWQVDPPPLRSRAHWTSLIIQTVIKSYFLIKFQKKRRLSNFEDQSIYYNLRARDGSDEVLLIQVPLLILLINLIV